MNLSIQTLDKIHGTFYTLFRAIYNVPPFLRSDTAKLMAQQVIDGLKLSFYTSGVYLNSGRGNYFKQLTSFSLSSDAFPYHFRVTVFHLQKKKKGKKRNLSVKRSNPQEIKSGNEVIERNGMRNK